MDNLAHRVIESPVSVADLSSTIGHEQNNSQRLSWASKQALDIFDELAEFRRTSLACASSPCSACLAPHLSKVSSAILNQEPITLVLPAFPGKSPNLAKVLGPLPDLGEKYSLEFLHQLCERIRRRYTPGARILLCSDGRVFSDLVGMREEDVSSYQRELRAIIEQQALSNISTFDLDELYRHHDFVRMRAELMEQYGQPLESLKEKVRQGKHADSDQDCGEAHRMYCGITRFLVEDAMHPQQVKSRTAIQKECRRRAYEVILRSNAWSELIADRFPQAVRLSIHPQVCGAKKFGIQLMGNDSWMTPWHGVAVDVGGHFILLKRSKAEALGAEPMYFSDGRPSHYKLLEN